MKRLAFPLLLALVAGLYLAPRVAPQTSSSTRVEDVIYGRKDGVALTLDVFKPARPNGIGVLYMVSGGWFSSHEAIQPVFGTRFMDRGQTVFAVVHGSQPKFTIPEILQDIHRAVRFVRYHAREYGVDPERLGITGGSAGGHLSLMIGTTGRRGDKDAKDPVERESSRVQAVACFFPPTDFLNWGEEGREVLAVERMDRYRPAFGPRIMDRDRRRDFQREISPIYHITKNTPPTLIIHGDSDELVPLQQSRAMVRALEKDGVPAELVIRPGKGHGWPGLDEDLTLFADWFDKYLAPAKAP